MRLIPDSISTERGIQKPLLVFYMDAAIQDGINCTVWLRSDFAQHLAEDFSIREDFIINLAQAVRQAIEAVKPKGRIQ